MLLPSGFHEPCCSWAGVAITAEVRSDWLALHALVTGMFRDFRAAEGWLARAEELSPRRPWLLVERAALLGQRCRRRRWNCQQHAHGGGECAGPRHGADLSPGTSGCGRKRCIPSGPLPALARRGRLALRLYSCIFGYMVK